jgi:hypothetical protein
MQDGGRVWHGEIKDRIVVVALEMHLRIAGEIPRGVLDHLAVHASGESPVEDHRR